MICLTTEPYCLDGSLSNYEQLKEKYDLILIDTHNDAGLLAQNAWAVSDLVVGISDPSKDGFEALLKLGKDIDALANS